MSETKDPQTASDKALELIREIETRVLQDSGERLSINRTVISAVVLGAGLVLVGIALSVSSLLLAGFGVVAAAVNVFLVNYNLHQLCTGTSGDKWRVRSVVAGSTGYPLIGAPLMALAVRIGSGSLALLATWVLAVSLAAFAAAIRPMSRKHPTTWTVGGIVATVAALIASVIWTEVDVLITAAMLAAIFGLSMTSIGLVRLGAKRPTEWLWVGVIVLVGGAGFLFFGPRTVVAVVSSVLVIGFGLLSISRSAPMRARDWNRFRYLAVFSIGLAVAAIVMVLSQADWPVVMTVAAAFLAALIAAALVSDFVELAVLVLVGVAIAAVVTDRTDLASTSPHPDADQRIVAIGDSYMSGEGARQFFPGVNVVGENECRRTSTAYAYLVAEKLGMGLDFFACSGADIDHLYAVGQQEAVVPGVPGGEPQLDNFEPGLPVAAVLISIGGNDAWFGSVGQACIAPASCDVHRTTVLRNVGRIGSDIEGVYAVVKERFGPDVPVVAIPYPLVMTEAGCASSPLAASEHRFLFEFTELLNDRVRVSAAEAGVNYFEPAITAFAGLMACEGDPGDYPVNVVHLNPKEGPLVDRLSPVSWIHGSAHPNAIGHELTASKLIPWLDDLLSQVAGGTRPANPEPQATSFAVSLVSSVRSVSTRPLAIPEGLPCPKGELPTRAFASSESLGSRFRFSDVEPMSSICFTLPDGTWKTDEVADEDGVVDFPGWSTDSVELGPDELLGHSQILIRRDFRGDWVVRVHEYCELDPNCAEDDAAMQEWALAHVRETAKAASAPMILIFIGFWFAAIDIRRVLLRRRFEAQEPPTA